MHLPPGRLSHYFLPRRFDYNFTNLNATEGAYDGFTQLARKTFAAAVHALGKISLWHNDNLDLRRVKVGLRDYGRC